jgi:hypothetical protein
MGADEQRELEESIKRNGLRHPIVLLDDEVLDGVHRQEACVKTGVAPRYVQFEKISNGTSAVEFVMDNNLRRRHLTASQRAAVAVDALPFFEAEAKKRQLGSLKRGDNLPLPPNGGNGQDKGTSAEKAAKATGASGRQVERAKSLKKKSPAKFDKVKKGELTLSKAERDKAKAKAKKEEMETAFARIEKVCGKNLADAVRAKRRLKNPKDVIAFASMETDDMKRASGLIELGWKLKAAKLFRAKNLSRKHLIGDLINVAASRGGSLTVDIDQWRIKAELVKRAIV